MRKTHRMFMQGDYQGALVVLRKEAQQDWQDDFRIGATCHVGAVLICLGEHDEAIEHFEQLIDSSPYRVSLHRLFLGLAYWYSRRKKQAMKEWEETLHRSQYNRFHGFDVPFLLYFVATTAPKYYSLAAVKERLIPLYKNYEEIAYFETHTAAYLLDLIDENQYAKVLADITEGKRIRERIADNLALMQFYTACKSAERHRKSDYRRLMSECAVARHDDYFSLELIVARCEANSFTK